MKVDLTEIKVVLAKKSDESHKRGVWKVFNENIQFFRLTSKPISYENHSQWWERIFDDEFIYIILDEFKVCGYIRLTKRQTSSKEMNEISITLLKKYQNSGVGTYAYKLFEKEIKKLGINEIVAIVDFLNIAGQKFFESNEFKKSYLKFIKKI